MMAGATAPSGRLQAGKTPPELIGLAVAVVAHVVLMLILSRGITPEPAPPPEPMEVSFVEDVGPVSSAPPVFEEPAPAIGEQTATASEASGSEASVPEPAVRPPVAEPVRPPAQTTERQRPDQTRSPVVVRSPPPAPRATPQRERPRPAPPREAQRQPQRQPQARPQQPGPARPTPPAAQRGPSFADVARRVGTAAPTARGTAPTQRSSSASTQERASFTAALASKINRCTSAQRPSTQEARTLRPVVVIRLRQDGSLDGAPVVRAVEGLNDTNRQYETQVREAMIRAVRNCAPYTGLPDELYGVPNGWQQPPPIRMTFR